MIPQNKNEVFPILQPNLQISFYQRLQTFRHSHLVEALGATVGKIDISQVDDELASYVERSSLAKLASFGLRGELLYPVPCIIIARPSLLGYYRLLYGLSQKEFYRTSPISSFKRLEERNELTDTLIERLGDLCKSLIYTGHILLEAMEELSLQTIRDLQLLTLGAQLRGGQNTKLGKDAAAEVFSIIENIVHENVVEEATRKLILENAAGRRVTVAFSSDPDIAITEMMASGPRPVVSIEIKGGTDVSNIHNRIGEAEKSHQKAKSHGFFEFWTIIGANVDLEMARRESPTSSRFFHLSELRNAKSAEYESFRDHVQSIIGIRTA